MKVLVSSWIGAIVWAFRIIGSAAYRFWWDDCFSRASALAYTSLFSLVPLVALSLSMFTAFGFNYEEFVAFLHTVVEQLLPPMGEDQFSQFQKQVLEYLEIFSGVIAGRALNAVSVAVLLFSGIALVNTIESAMNVIWRVTSELSIMAKLTRFWAVITLGPVLIAVSIYWTTQVRAYTSEHSVIAESAIWSLMNVIIPIAVTWLALLILYVTMPSAKVRLRDAALGSLIAAALFELVKSGFAHYLTMTSTYSKLYGILASIPLFLLWLYIAWVVVLYGAQIAYEAGAIVIRSGRRRYATDLGEIGAILGLRILHLIGENFMDGNEPPTESEIAIEIGTDPVLVRTVLDLLTDARIITTGDNERHARTLCVAPSKLRLCDIAKTFMSKEYLKKNGNDEHKEGTFLQAFYAASRSAEKGVPPAEWTLADFIMLSTDMTEAKNN